MKRVQEFNIFVNMAVNLIGLRKMITQFVTFDVYSFDFERKG